MRFVLAATVLAGFLASPAAAQWDRGGSLPDADGPRFSADDDDGPRDRGRRAFGSRDPDEIMPRRRDRDRDRDAGRRDWDDRSRADRYDRYDRYGPPPYGPGIAPPAAPGGVFVVPPPIPGARNH